MDANLILYLMCGVLGFSFVLERVLEALNTRGISQSLPEDQKEFYDEAEYGRFKAYYKEKLGLSLLSSIVSLAFLLFVLLSGFLGKLDTYLMKITEDTIFRGLLFFGILYVGGDLLSLPISIYRTFRIEQKFGFNKTTPATFILDKIKGYLLAALLGGGIMYLLLLFIDIRENDFWIWFWIAISLISLIIQFLYPTIGIPIFNKLQPLEQGSLRESIEAYAKKVNYPLRNVMVMNGSKRSTKANAFFTGFGRNKRIVLFDTMIEQLEEDELVAVLAHEVGHYKKRHIVSGILLSILSMGIMLFILSRVVFEPNFSFALGADQAAIHLNLTAFALLYSPISQLIGLAFNVISRKNEYQADDFARTTSDGKALGSALVKLHVNTLSNLKPHPAYVFVHYSHPPLLMRLKALRKA